VGYGPSRHWGLLVGLLVVLVVVFVAVQLIRPVPSVALSNAHSGDLSIPGRASLPWPTQGQAAVDIEGMGSLGSTGGNAAVSIASITKVMTALLVLEDHPISVGSSGPSITVSQADVSIYQIDLASQQSVVQVTAGEQLSELQALQAMLIGSGNNVAQMLANWDAGSSSAFVSKMNDKAKSLGLGQTHYVSPSGVEDANVSNAVDQIHLAEVAMDNPVFADIVSEPQVTLPVAGVIYNFDYDLGQDGIVGVKTGSSAAAGGCFVFLAHQSVGSRQVSVVGAVLGQQGQSPITTALSVAQSLVTASVSSLHPTTVVRTGQQVGQVVAPWGASSAVTAGADVNMLAAPGMVAQTRLSSTNLGSSAVAGAKVGSLTVTLGTERVTVPAVASNDVGGPSIVWRLFRF
jgi:serine-type D-Ala-D-Ala carboxypeptidase (penicillin-binding protein 5/6)